MSKPRIPNQRRANIEHKKRTERYAQLIQQIYDRGAQEAARLASMSGADPSKPFSFSDYPFAAQAAKQLQSQLYNTVYAVIMSGTSEEWKESNLVQNLVARRILAAYTGTTKSGEEYTRYYQTNPDALKAFQKRREGGMNLSDRVWNLSEEYRVELEDAISAAIAPGISAQELSRDVKKYLNEPDLMFRRFRYKNENGEWKRKWKKRYTDDEGNVRFIDCDRDSYRNQWTGPGYYKSAAKNAMRLARTEINMAYRTSEQERWRQFDFVVGYEVKTTQNGKHKEDICDRLAGKYPKDFKFVGWHPQCMCYTIPILKTEEEFWAYDPENPQRSANEITDVPQNFKDWIKDNRERIESAEKRGKLPYFIRDNREDVEEILNPKESRKNPLDIAAERHAARTQEDVERIQSAWNEKLMRDLFNQSDRIGSYRDKEFRELALLLNDDNDLKYYDVFKQDYQLAKKYLQDKINADTALTEAFLKDKLNIENMRALAKALGIDEGMPMTFFEANELRGNPNYSANEIYRINCQTCVVAHELRRRGFDIQALGNTKGSWLDKLSNGTNKIWLDENGNVPEKQVIGAQWVKKHSNYHGREVWQWEKTVANRKQLISKLEDAITEDGRYHIDWDWKGKTGHIICLEKQGDNLFYYDPQNGKIITDFYGYIEKINLKRGIKLLRVDNLRVDPDFASHILTKAGDKAKSGTASISGITGGDIKADVADFVKRRNAASTNKERVALDLDIIRKGDFIRSEHHSTAKGSIFATEELPKNIRKEDLELSKNIQMAKKMANNGYDCYLLSNPNATTSADFIFVKNGKAYYTEGKLSTGKNSLDHNLSKGKTQAERVLIDLTNTRDTNYISSQLEKAFEENDSLREVMLLKKGRLIQVNEMMISRKDFKRHFKKIWEQKK